MGKDFYVYFDGDLEFNKKLSVEQIEKLKSILNENYENHPEWQGRESIVIDLKINRDESGVDWWYTMEYDEYQNDFELGQSIEFVIKEMKKDYPDFNLTGTLVGRIGQYSPPSLVLDVRDGKVIEHETETILKGSLDKCPHCGHHLELEILG